MGLKIEARQRAQRAGIRSFRVEALSDIEDAVSYAASIGYPVMLKASEEVAAAACASAAPMTTYVAKCRLRSQRHARRSATTVFSSKNISSIRTN
jgi:biotin carboxylase